MSCFTLKRLIIDYLLRFVFYINDLRISLPLPNLLCSNFILSPCKSRTGTQFMSLLQAIMIHCTRQTNCCLLSSKDVFFFLFLLCLKKKKVFCFIFISFLMVYSFFILFFFTPFPSDLSSIRKGSY